MAAEHHQTALVLVSQELKAFVVLEWMEILILLVEKDGIRLCKGMEGLQDGVECLRTFCAVQYQCPLRGLDELRLARLEDTRSARILWLAECGMLAR